MQCLTPTTPTIVGLASEILTIDVALIATAITVVTIVPALMDGRSSSTEGYFSRTRRRRKLRSAAAMLAASVPIFALSAIAALVTLASDSIISGYVAAIFSAVGAAFALIPSVLVALDLRDPSDEIDAN